MVLSILCIILNRNTDNLTSFVAPKGREYTLRRYDGSKPHLTSFFSAVGGGRFFRLISRLYIVLHVKPSIFSVLHGGSSVCNFKSSFQGLGIADKSP